MNQLIRRLIDVYLVQPLATAVTQHLAGGQQTIMDALDQIQQQLDGLAGDMREVKLRTDKVLSRLDDLQKQVDGHPSIDADPRLAAISSEIAGIRTAAASIVPDPPAVPAATDAAAADAPPPASTGDFKAGKDQGS